jgi:hypothetical protein
VVWLRTEHRRISDEARERERERKIKRKTKRRRDKKAQLEVIHAKMRGRIGNSQKQKTHMYPSFKLIFMCTQKRFKKEIRNTDQLSAVFLLLW